MADTESPPLPTEKPPVERLDINGYLAESPLPASPFAPNQAQALARIYPGVHTREEWAAAVNQYFTGRI